LYIYENPSNKKEDQNPKTRAHRRIPTCNRHWLSGFSLSSWCRLSKNHQGQSNKCEPHSNVGVTLQLKTQISRQTQEWHFNSNADFIKQETWKSFSII